MGVRPLIRATLTAIAVLAIVPASVPGAQPPRPESPEPLPEPSPLVVPGESPVPYTSPVPDVRTIRPFADHSPADSGRTGPLSPPPDLRDVLPARPCEGRCLRPRLATWEASNIRYCPLLFEDPQLERYGHRLPCGLQPFASVGRMGGQFLGAPHELVRDPGYRYPLGWFRPGDVCAPKQIRVPAVDAKGGVAEAAAAAAVFLVLP